MPRFRIYDKERMVESVSRRRMLRMPSCNT
jgi:hypothetical protein